MMIRARTWLRRLVAALDDGDDHVDTPPVPIREIFRQFWPYARPCRGWLALTLLLVLLGPAIETGTIWTFKLLVDDVLVPQNFGEFGRIALLYVGLTLVGGAVSFGHDYLSAWIGERFLLALRTRLFRHLHTLSLDFFERQALGDIVARLTSDVAAIESLVLQGTASALAYAFRIVFFMGALFWLQWELALISLLVAPLFWWTARHFSQRIKAVAREQRRRAGAISAVAEESFANAMLVQAYNGQAVEDARFHRQSLGSLRAQMAATRLRALFSPLVDLIELGGVLLVIALGSWAIAQERLSLGGLLVFITYLSQLYGPIRGLGRLSNTAYAASASAERILEFLAQRPAAPEPAAPAALPRAHGRLAFDAVTFHYPGRPQPALRDISFTVEPGETVALVGGSGAGKSTVAKLLLRFYDPAAGRILLDGHDLRQLRLHELRQNVAIVLQEALILDGTARASIAYGRPEATEADIVRAARAADAHEFIAALPDGYDTLVGQKGRRLSGGQRQRIAIARAMLRDAPLLILDEPTTGLDALASERVLAPLRRLMAGRTTVIISHQLWTVREATVILLLDAGQIVERGTHAELLARDGAYARLWRLHAPDAAPTPVHV